MTEKQDDQEPQRSGTHVSSQTVMASNSQLRARCDSQHSSMNKQPSSSHSKIRQDQNGQLFSNLNMTAPQRQSLNKNNGRHGDAEEDDLVVAPLGKDNAPVLQNKQLQQVTGKRRQLSNFNVKQRLSTGQVVQATLKHQAQHHEQSPEQSRGYQTIPAKMDSLVHQQNKQHQAYISRTSNNNQQVLSQSIGEGSNKSYVFDGMSQVPPANIAGGSGEPQNYAMRANLRADLPGSSHAVVQNQQTGNNNIPADNRSLSNESSPTSLLQTRNLIYKNVRNYNNLYDNRSLASKNVEMQDRMRLGGAQKLWTFKKSEPFLPQITNHHLGSSALNEIGATTMMQSHMSGYTNQKMQKTNKDSQSTQMTNMKRIKHSVMEDGHQMLELRQSPISSTKVEKPATTHGYQSTHHQGGMASTEPLNQHMPNMTSTSFNGRDDRADVMSKANTANVPFLPELSMSSNFGLMSQVNMLKPILRRNCLHNRNNIVIQWKSFEIQTVKLTYLSSSDTLQNKITSRKLLNPVYVPLQELSHLLGLHPSQIETRVIKSLKPGPDGKNFMYVPYDVPYGQQPDSASETFSRRPSFSSSVNNANGKNVMSPKDSNLGNTSFFDGMTPERNTSFKQVAASDQHPDNSVLGKTHNSSTSNLGDLEDKLPDEIVTSLYIQQVGSDYTIVIRPPSIEYSIPSKNFLFIKTLSRDENADFLSNKFADWQNMAIRCLTKYSKFNELLSIMDRGVDYKVHLARQEAQKYQVPKEPAVIPNKSRSPSNLRRSVNKLALAQPGHRRNHQQQTSGASPMQVYVLQEATGQILYYPNLNEYRMERLIDPKNGALAGCFLQNNSIGQISVKPFSVVIKGLDTDYEYRHTFIKANWSKLIGFMQLKSMKQPDDPKQLVDKLSKHFERAVLRANYKGSNEINFKASTVLTSKKQLQAAVGSPKAIRCYPMMTKEEKINEKAHELAHQTIREPSKTTQQLTDLQKGGIVGAAVQSPRDRQTDKQNIPQQQSKDSIEQLQKRFVQDSKQAARSFLAPQKPSKILQVPKRANPEFPDQPVEMLRFLIEFEIPVCTVNFQGQTHTKVLTEEDLVHLAATQFCRWKNFLMTKHFRLELNIGQEKPLPRIMEDKRGEDDLISETDPRDKYPITEAEKPKIEETRTQVHNWFPV